MTDSDIVSTVIAIIANTKRLDESTMGMDTDLGSLGIESLDIVVIMHEIEDHWNLTVPDGELEKFRSIADIVNAVEAAVDA